MPSVDEYNQVVGADPTPPPPPSPTLGGGDTYLDRLVGLGISPEQEKAITKGLAKGKEEEIAARQGITDEMNRGISEWEHVGEDAYKATQASMAAIPPKWDANAESAKYATNPIMAFGSAASVFGILAASFTHAPMMNALNASAAAMNAYAKGDQEAYNRAHDAWKENTDLAIKRHNMMHEAYEDAMQMMKTKPEIARVRLEALATQYQDKAMLTMLQNGLDPQLDELRSKRALVAQQVSQAALGMMKIDAVKQLDDAYRGGKPEDIKAAQQHAKDVQEMFSPSYGRGGSPLQQRMAAAIDKLEDARARGDEPGIAAALQEIDDIGRGMRPQAPPKAGSEGAWVTDPKHRQDAIAALGPGKSATEYDKWITQQWVEANRRMPIPRPGSKEDFINTDKMELLLENAAQRKQAEQARARGENVPDVPELNEAQANSQAISDYRLANNPTSIISTVESEKPLAKRVYDGLQRMPSSFYQNRHSKFNEAFDEVVKEGGAPYDPTKYERSISAARVEATAGPRSLAAAKTQLETTLAATESFAQFADVNGRNLLDTANAMTHWGIPAINAIATYSARELEGDRVAADYLLQIKTYQREATRLIENPRLVGSLTDTSKADIKEALPTYSNFDQLVTLVNRVRIDGRNRQITLENEIKKIQDKLDHKSTETIDFLARGRTALANGVPRDKVIEQLQMLGVDTSSL